MEECDVYLNGEDDLCHLKPDETCLIALNEGIASGSLDDYINRMQGYSDSMLQGMIDAMSPDGLWHDRCRISNEIAEAARSVLAARK